MVCRLHQTMMQLRRDTLTAEEWNTMFVIIRGGHMARQREVRSGRAGCGEWLSVCILVCLSLLRRSLNGVS